MGEETTLRREDDRQMGKVLALLERIEKQQCETNEKLQEITDGTRQLPQCRDHERRLDDIEKKISQHSYNQLNHRLEVIEKRDAEQKEFNRWTIRSVLGAVIAVIVYFLRDKILH